MTTTAKTPAQQALATLLAEYDARENVIRQGGGPKGIERQHRHGRLTARERIDLLCDRHEGTEARRHEVRTGSEAPSSLRGSVASWLFLETGLWAAEGMYPDVGDVAAAGVVVGLGRVAGRLCVVVANDATVKAGAFFPQTCKKVLRAQRFGPEREGKRGELLGDDKA